MSNLPYALETQVGGSAPLKRTTLLASFVMPNNAAVVLRLIRKLL
ncbi:MAG: hypothetical protein ACJ8G2_14190 [Burkholderiales bacterium]